MSNVLVSKPQFNTDDIKPGMAIKVTSTDRNDWYGFNHDCLVVDSTPLKLTLAYVAKRNKGVLDEDDRDDYTDGYTSTKVLPVDLVAGGQVKIHKLGVVDSE